MSRKFPYGGLLLAALGCGSATLPGGQGGAAGGPNSAGGHAGGLGAGGAGGRGQSGTGGPAGTGGTAGPGGAGGAQLGTGGISSDPAGHSGTGAGGAAGGGASGTSGGHGGSAAGQGGTAGAAGVGGTVASGGTMGSGGVAGTGGAAGSGGAGGHGGATGSGGAAGTGGGAGSAATGGMAGSAGLPGPGAVGIGCKQQKIPAAVLQGDYGCFDFDNGTAPLDGPGDEQWLTLTNSPATGVTTTDRAASPTYSYQVNAPSSSNAVVAWGPNSTSTASVTHVVVAADILPTGVQMSVMLLHLSTGSGDAMLYYGVTNSGTQLSLRVDYSGANQTSNTYAVAGTLPLNTWSRVQLEIDTVAQVVRLTVPGQTNAPVSSVFDPDPGASVSVGPWVQQGAFNGYLDDLVAYVTR